MNISNHEPLMHKGSFAMSCPVNLCYVMFVNNIYPTNFINEKK